MDLITQLVSQGLSAILPFIILLGLLIFVHELGHFLVAIACGVHVEVFSLGFGKKLVQYTKNGTTYCISLIPLGGYVKMYGDDVNADIPLEQRSKSFTHKNVYQRIAIVLAGPLMNFFFAILIFGVVSGMGEDARAPIVGDIAATSKVASAGLFSGSQIIEADGKPVKTWDDVQDIFNARVGFPVALKAQGPEGSAPVQLEVIPEAKANPHILSTDSVIGVVPELSLTSLAPVIGVREGSPAFTAGLRTGDRVLSVNGKEARYYRDLSQFWPTDGSTLKLEVERTEVVGSMDPAAKRTPPKSEKLFVDVAGPKAFSEMGIETSELYLFSIVQGSPAEKAGLRSGDRITGINSNSISNWESVVENIKSFNGKDAVQVQVVRGTEAQTFAIVPEMTTQTTLFGGEEKRFTIGIVPWVQMAPPELVKVYSDGIASAAVRGFDRTVEASAMTLMSFLRLIQGVISPKHIGGVISIGQAAHETYKSGLNQFLTMMALISVHLFILNLLPVPVLDGGHLLFYSIELLRGTPLSMRKLEIAQQVGLVLLMSLMAFALFNDFSRVLGLW